MKKSYLYGIVTLLLFVMMANGGFAQEPAQPSVREILNADGSVRLDREGGYSLEGYELRVDANGEPRVVPKDEVQTQSTGGSWGTGFGSPNGVNGVVYALAVYNGELYVGGRFTQAGGVSANFIARWNGTSWNTLGTGTNNGVNGGVFALAVYNGELYVGGYFTRAGGVSANHIVRWNGTSWNTLGTGTNNGVNSEVRVLAVYNGELYVVGLFTQAGGVSARYIARWNGTSWNSVGTGANNEVNGFVTALAVYNGELYVGGIFTQVGSMSANAIARWNGTSWNTLGTGTNNGVNGGVFALAVYNGELYVGGSFSLAGGVSAVCIARWNGTSWNSVGTGANNGVDGRVDALAVYNGELYVGGVFTQAGGVSARRIARWNGTSWSSVGTGSGNGVGGASSPSVNALAVYNNSLFLGGNFTQVNIGDNPIPSSYIARWTSSTVSTDEPSPNTPKGFALLQNYPNPFNPTTTITYQLPTAGVVSLKVYDVVGKEVATLVSARQEAGTYSIPFNASGLASGIYFYRLQAGGFVQTKKMMLVK